MDVFLEWEAYYLEQHDYHTHFFWALATKSIGHVNGRIEVAIETAMAAANNTENEDNNSDDTAPDPTQSGSMSEPTPTYSSSMSSGRIVSP